MLPPARLGAKVRRRASALALFAGLIAVVAALSVWAEDDGIDAPRNDAPVVDRGRGSESSTGAANGEAAISRVFPAGVPLVEEGGSGSSPAAVDPANLQHGNLVLRAFDDTTFAWLPAFTWSLVHDVPGVPARGVSEAAAATVAVPLRIACAFVVEAEGYFASLPVDGTLQDGFFREVHVALVPRPASASVRIVARDEFGQPVTRLRAECRSRGVDREAKGAFTEVYELTSVADSGVHELPAPPEGWCRLSLSPLPFADDARILQSHEVEFRQAATEAIEREVVFAAGARLVVVARGEVGDLRLCDGAARPLATPFVQGSVRGEAREWHAALALGPGDYAVAYRLGGQSFSRSFRLAAGQELRLLLP